MRHCPRCKIDVFGGSRCDACGGPLVEKAEKGTATVVHVTKDMILGPRRRLKSDLAQSKSGRVFRLVLEIVLFCLLFLGVSWVGHHIANFLSVNMSDDPDKARLNPPIDWWSTGFLYYWMYPGWAIVTVLTIKFRWRAGK
jgi:hypothetical protein